MTEPREMPDLVFLLDVDNTLLDNDALKEDLASRIEGLVGAERAKAFWVMYENVRRRQEYVDLPATVREWALAYADKTMATRLDHALASIDFRRYVYPGVLETIGHLESLGKVVILSDGDPVFQRRKICESGLAKAVDGHVMIAVHKEAELSELFSTYPADHYVMVDDRPRILSALESSCPTAFTTVLVLQGAHAVEGAYQPTPDYVVHHTTELREFTAADFLKTDPQPRPNQD